MGLLFGLGIIGMVLLVSERETRDRGVLLATLVLPTTVLYMAYYWGGGMGGLRFLMPTFYLYALAAVWLLRDLVTRMGRPAEWATGATVVLAVLWGAAQSGQELSQRQRRDSTLVTLTDTVRQHVPEGGALFADRMTAQHLDVMGDWRLGQIEALMLGEGERFARMGLPRVAGPPGTGRLGPIDGSIRGPAPNATAARETPQASGTPVRAAPNPVAGGARERLARYRDLKREERSQLIRADLQAWVGEGGKAYFLAPRQELTTQLARMGLGHAWRELATIDLPVLDDDPDGPGRPGLDRRGRQMPGRMDGRMPRRAMGMMGMRPFRGPGGLGRSGADSPLVLAVVSL
jgi:hypothetical protein